jgi:hypothetical protein
VGQRWTDSDQLRRHNEYEYAHAEAFDRAIVPVRDELGIIRKTQERMLGGLIVIGALIGGGVLGLVGHVLKLW